jgi:uncharacterized protein (TIGR03086 family)
MDLATLHRRAVASWEDRVLAVGPGSWDDPTPCEKWSARDLVNHVVGEELWAVPLLAGATIAEVGDRFDGDVLGADPASSAQAAAEAAVRSVDDALPRGVTVHLSYGEESAEEYVRQLVADHLVHGWDLAAATGGETRLDPELVAEVAAWFAGREDLYRAAGIIGPRVHTDPDDPQAQLIAGFGRDPHWSAAP